MNGDNDDTSTSEPPLSDVDPFGIRQIMLPVVSFRSSAKVNAHHDNGRDRGSRSRRALKNKVQASSFALHQAYWERSSSTSNQYLRKRESPAPELSLSSSWEDIEFDDDDSALFAPDIENSSTISDDDAPLSWPSPPDKSLETETEACHQDDKANQRRPGDLDEGVISLRVHRAYQNYTRTKADEVKKPIGGDNAPAVATHEFLLVRKKLNRIKSGQASETKEGDKRHIGPKDINKAAKVITVDEGGPNLASKAASFDVLPLNLTDLTSPESLDADSCRSTENEASTDDLPAEIPKKSIHVDIAYDSPGNVSLETEKIVTANDPRYEKYHRMLKVGLPLPAVIHACERDGVDPTFLQKNRPSHHPPSISKGSEIQQQDSHRRTRLHWKILPRVGKNSVWALLDRETDELDNLRIDPAEFCELFEAKKEDRRMSNTKQTFRDRSLQPLIDPKRNKNGSILLSALKRDPVDLARDVDEM